MSNAEQAHISPEQLEEAACGRLPAHSLAAVEAHCAVCSPCRTAYDQELLIVRGTRSWARAALPPGPWLGPGVLEESQARDAR